MSAMRFDLPTPEADTQAFWDAAADGALLIKRCRACGRPHFYPRPFCPHCWSHEVEWEQASGRATLYTWSTVHVNDLPPFNERVPYVAAIVDLDEGPRMMSELVELGNRAPLIGMTLKVTFRVEDGRLAIPVFRPAPAPPPS